MKKIMSMVIVLLMLFMACSCNSGTKVTTEAETTTETETITETEAATESEEAVAKQEVVSLHMNETIAIDNIEFTITDVRSYESFHNGTQSNVVYTADDGKCFVVVYYTMKNIGKTKVNPTSYYPVLEYSDGYRFNSDYFFCSKINSDIINSYNGGTSTVATLEVLGDPVYFMEAFEVPSVVIENTEEPLLIRLKTSQTGEDNAIYNIRPVDELQKAALYEKALSLKEEGLIYWAKEKAKEAEDYEGADVLYDECMTLLVLHCGTSSDDYEEYIYKRADELEVISGDALAAVLVGDLQLIIGSNTSNDVWHFSADGTIDDKMGKNRTWKINGDYLDFALDGKVYWTVVVKKLIEGGYLLFNLDGTFCSTMYVPEG